MQVETRQRLILWVHSQIWVFAGIVNALKKEDFYEHAGARTAVALVVVLIVVVVTVVYALLLLLRFELSLGATLGRVSLETTRERKGESE